MKCQSLSLQAVGKFCCGGNAMNEPSTNSFFVVLLFILRCLVPLAILFGVSYLLRRMGLVAIEAPEPPEPKEEAVEKTTKSPDETASPKKMTSAPQSKKPKKRKVSPPRKKTAKKTKAGTSRSRSK
jgi:outer membrane biosynthesis protein TonB